MLEEGEAIAKDKQLKQNYSDKSENKSCLWWVVARRDLGMLILSLSWSRERLSSCVHFVKSIKLYIYDVHSFSWVCYMSMRQFLNSRFSKLSLGNHISISFNGESHGCENYQWWYHTVAEMYHKSLLCQRLSLFSGGSEPNVRVNSAACGRKSKNTQDRMKQPQGKFQGHLRNLTASL